MLSKKSLEEKIARYLANKALIEEFEAEQEEIKKVVTKEMERRNVEELAVGSNVVRWTEYEQKRFDGSAFKKANPEVYEAWQKSVKSHRFSVA